MMTKHSLNILVLCLFLGISTLGHAGTHYTDPQYATLVDVDQKNKTIIVRGTLYKLRQGVKIHLGNYRFPTLSMLPVGHQIKFQTRKNQRTGVVEISEIWILDR